MNKLYTLFLCLCMVCFVQPMLGQSTQRIIVKEYIPIVSGSDEANAEKRPLANVEIQVQGANSTITNKNGECILKFARLIPGNRILVRHLSRTGYEILFPRMLNGLVIRSDDEPIEILMISQDNMNQRYHRVEKYVNNHLDKQKKRELEALDKSAKDYALRREEIERRYTAKLDDIEFYIDRLCRIDLTNLNSYEQELTDAYRNGDLEKILGLLERSNLIEKYKSVSDELQNVRKAQAKINQARVSHENSLKDIQQYLKFQITLLKMEGTEASLQKATKLLEQMLHVNPFDYFAAKEKIELSVLQNDYHFMDSLLRATIESPNVNKYRFCRASTDLASILFEQNRLDEAWDVLKRADSIRFTLYLNERESSLSVFHRFVNNQIMGHVCLVRGEQEAAVAHLLEAFDAYKYLRIVDASSKLYADATYPRLIKIIYDMGELGEWNLADSIYQCSRTRVDTLYKRGSVKERFICMSYMMWDVHRNYKLGNNENAYLLQLEALPELEHIYSINRVLGQELYQQALRNIARYLYLQKNYEQTIKYSNLWFSVLRGMRQKGPGDDPESTKQTFKLENLNRYTDMLAMYAYSLSQTGQIHHTEAVYCEVIDIMENNPELIKLRPKRLALCYANVSELRLDRGEIESARRYAAKALQLNPDSKTANEVQARILVIDQEKNATSSSKGRGRKK